MITPPDRADGAYQSELLATSLGVRGEQVEYRPVI